MPRSYPSMGESQMWSIDGYELCKYHQFSSLFITKTPLSPSRYKPQCAFRVDVSAQNKRPDTNRSALCIWTPFGNLNAASICPIVSLPNLRLSYRFFFDQAASICPMAGLPNLFKSYGLFFTGVRIHLSYGQSATQASEL